MKGAELDPRLWHACARGMIQVPPVNSKVYYFPQGHAEHTLSPVDFGALSRIPSLIPVRSNESDSSDKPASFAKTLTQSDANNGSGFSVPRYYAETIFPHLDYSTGPPVQTIVVKDVHGVI